MDKYPKLKDKKDIPVWPLEITKLVADDINLTLEGIKFDKAKARPSLVPPVAMQHVIDAFEYGARKYSPDNWKLVIDAEVRYLDALMRHVEGYRLGEYYAKDSLLPHLAHVVANALILMELRETVTMTAPQTMKEDKTVSISMYER